MWLDDVKFDEKGLVPVIAQRTSDGKVMMLAWANREALEETARTGRGVYFPAPGASSGARVKSPATSSL